MSYLVVWFRLTISFMVTLMALGRIVNRTYLQIPQYTIQNRRMCILFWMVYCRIRDRSIVVDDNTQRPKNWCCNPNKYRIQNMLYDSTCKNYEHGLHFDVFYCGLVAWTTSFVVPYMASGSTRRLPWKQTCCYNALQCSDTIIIEIERGHKYFLHLRDTQISPSWASSVVSLLNICKKTGGIVLKFSAFTNAHSADECVEYK